MDWTSPTAALAIVAFVAALAFAIFSKRDVDKRLRDQSARQQTGSKDC
ncbi:hypothetical protein K3757_12650 [Sulfitobacter sp. S223]|nr:hypothetical protein [Sulfitobacter sp. S223]UWR25317.1 hypothetical protein K3757_12650 [Sulfitobacter sp. S223]